MGGTYVQPKAKECLLHHSRQPLKRGPPSFLSLYSPPELNFVTWETGNWKFQFSISVLPPIISSNWSHMSFHLHFGVKIWSVLLLLLKIIYRQVFVGIAADDIELLFNTPLPFHPTNSSYLPPLCTLIDVTSFSNISY